MLYTCSQENVIIFKELRKKDDRQLYVEMKAYRINCQQALHKHTMCKDALCNQRGTNPYAYYQMLDTLKYVQYQAMVIRQQCLNFAERKFFSDQILTSDLLDPFDETADPGVKMWRFVKITFHLVFTQCDKSIWHMIINQSCKYADH